MTEYMRDQVLTAEFVSARSPLMQQAANTD